jgi:hypothetical protein
MNIASALITILGPAIARVILTVVLKPLIGEKFISDVSEEITGGLKDLVIPFLPNDEWAQHRGTRIFEDIGEEVAYSLQSVYQIEGSRYAEGEWLVVTKAVAQTLTRHISGTLLSSREWDKKSLSHYLLKADPNAVHSQEWELYKRVIEETSRRIIEVSIDLLPLITAQDMARLFSTTDIIRATTTETLSLVQKIYEESRVQNQETLEAIFEQNYREEIARNFDRVELLGVDSLRGTNRKQKLTVAYVSLHFEGSDIEFGKKQHNDALKSNSQSNKLVSVVDFLSKSSRLLISADAGFGKTTLLKWIAVHASQADFSANLQGMNEKVPIFIRLRSFAKEDSKLPTPLDFLKDSAPNSSEEASKGWITKKLRNGKAIILIDGLDEVGINRREQVFDWLHGLLEGFEQSTFIVTTRPYVLDQDASNYFAKKGFQAASIQRLSEMGTNELIDNWYKAVAIEEDANEQEQEQLSMLANKLKEQLTFNDSLKQLARIPLLTAILCALNRQYQRSLPEDRITLYEKCIETLLEGREKARNISLPDYPDLPLQVKQELMSSLAYWMLRNNYLGEASAAEAEKHFDSILQQLGQGITGHDALMLFKDRLSFLHSPT